MKFKRLNTAGLLIPLLVLGGIISHGDLAPIASTNSATNLTSPTQAVPVTDTMGNKELSDAKNQQKKLQTEELKLLAAFSNTSRKASDAAKSLSFSKTISGQAIVSTSSGGKIKLGGVNVALYTKEQIKQWIDGVNNLVQRERDSLSILCRYEPKSDFWSMRQYVWSNQTRYTNMLSALRAPLGLETKTDADGNFSIHVPALGGDYYILATESQQDGDDYKTYLWIAKADPNVQPLLLEDSNKAPDDLVSP